MVVPNLSFLGPASAYPVTDSAFAGGSLQASLRFSPPLGEIQGPSLRVLTNSTLDGAALRLTPGSTAVDWPDDLGPLGTRRAGEMPSRAG